LAVALGFGLVAFQGAASAASPHVARPAVNLVRPNHGPTAGGTSVTIYGYHLSGATAVDFGATAAASYSVVNSQQINAVSPEGTGTGPVNVTVTTPGGGKSANAPRFDSFTYVGPSVDELIPRFGPTAGGTAVQVIGRALKGATAVYFGTTAAASFSVAANGVINAVSPAGTGTVDVRVITPSGESPALPHRDAFKYVPTFVNGVTPHSGPAAGGTAVVISGRGLTGATAVDFGTTAAASFSVVSDTQVDAVSPAGSGVVDVTVTTPSGTSPANPPHDVFNFVTPFVGGLAPSHGPAAGGTAVVISGHGLTGATAVTFGTTPAASFSVVSDTQVDAVSPAGSGVVDVRVTTPSGESPVNPRHDAFAFVTPFVGGVSPNHGPIAGGTSVKITGHGLLGATAVDFGTTAAKSFTVVSGTQIDAVSPAGAGVVDVRVTTPSGTSPVHPANDAFHYTK
jgi:IPT/TIG domain